MITQEYAFIEQLAEIHKDLLLLNYNDESKEKRNENRMFLLGRAFEITKNLQEHPEWWNDGCNCSDCRSCY